MHVGVDLGAGALCTCLLPPAFGWGDGIIGCRLQHNKALWKSNCILIWIMQHFPKRFKRLACSSRVIHPCNILLNAPITKIQMFVCLYYFGKQWNKCLYVIRKVIIVFTAFIFLSTLIWTYFLITQLYRSGDICIHILIMVYTSIHLYIYTVMRLGCNATIHLYIQMCSSFIVH